jgi:outer membrane lipoprotein-sorting protein
VTALRAAVAVFAFSGTMLAFSVSGSSASSDIAAAPGVSVRDAETLLHRMVDVNTKLHTYTANVTLDIKMTSFPFLSPELTGVVYFKQPNKRAVVFDTVPALAEQAKKVYPKIDEPFDWERVYSITAMSEADGTTLFRLIPRKNGRVEHLDVNVDEATATIKSYTWTYKDGGFVTFDQTFTLIDGNYLPEKLSGHVEQAGYKANVTSALTNYKLNVAIADSVFIEK